MFIRHEFIERNAFLLLVLTLITIAIGGIVEVVPLFTIETTVEHVKGVRPYSPLEQRGRDIYVREGCYLCHSQQIRPFRDEVERYGHYSLANIDIAAGELERRIGAHALHPLDRRLDGEERHDLDDAADRDREQRQDEQEDGVLLDEFLAEDAHRRPLTAPVAGRAPASPPG